MSAWKGVVGKRFTPGEFRNYLDDLTLRDLSPDAWAPDFIVIHNTQIPTLAQWRGQRSIDGLVEFYRDEQQWSGGPHLFIDAEGIWVFTPLDVPGVHSPSWNGESWGVEIVGDFDREPFEGEQKALVFGALDAMHRRMGWLQPNIRLHKDDPKTTHSYCPGKNIDRVELESGVQTMLDLTK